MMNKSQIDWCNFSWNPITGCLHNCPYCYAKQMSKRFSGDIRLNKASSQIQGNPQMGWLLDSPFKNTKGKTIPFPVGFEPIFHKYRLADPSKKLKPAVIFVGSMADVFGEWVPDEWIKDIFKACKAAPWHKYLFLTKNPKRYAELEEQGILPKGNNFWYGSTTTTQGAPYWLSPEYNTFRSIEPIQGTFERFKTPNKYADWVIIGAETGQRSGKSKPAVESIKAIVENCRDTGTPVFLKNNLNEIWDGELIQEFPKKLLIPPQHLLPLKMSYIKNVRSKKHCKDCNKPLQGNSAWRMSAENYTCVSCKEEREKRGRVYDKWDKEDKP